MLYFSYPNESLTATLQFLRAKMLFATGAPIHAENYFGHVTPPSFALAVAGLAYLWMKKNTPGSSLPAR